MNPVDVPTPETGGQPEPAAPPEPAGEAVDLGAMSAELLTAAATDGGGKASRLVVHGPRQRAVLMAILAGGGLAEHGSPPAATLHVLSGRVRLYVGDEREWFVAAGGLVPIPPDRHAVDALEDSVVLLTVTLSG